MLQDNKLISSKGYIDGAWVTGQDGRVFDVRDPADSSLLAQVADLGADDTHRAIAAAEAAFPGWSSVPAKSRYDILMRWYDLILKAADDLALLLTREMGKPLTESKGEILYGASFIQWFAEEAKRTYGDMIPAQGPDKRIMVIKQPIGVVGAITPWNFPNAMITRKVGPALAAGCTVVLKPAAETPLSALALAVLAERAGMPPGVLNIVPSSRARDIGGALCASETVRKLTFTGSTEVGRILMQQCAHDIKKLSLELGGNAPFIVFDDADLDAAVEGAIASKYRNSGQTCVCANRIYVQDGIYDAFADAFAAKVGALKVGRGVDAGVALGPLISQEAVAKVEAHLADARAKGGTVLTGGGVHAHGGTYYQATVISGATADMKVAREETFGPLAPLFRFETEADVIAAANDTEFGLASYLYARDMARILRVAEALEYGMVAVNSGILSTEVAPFGGVKQSGLGREGSRYGIDDYLEMKYILLAGIGPVQT